MTNKLENSRSNIINPGPGSYDIPNTIKIQQSTSKQSQQKRFKPYETPVPGPGQYNTLTSNSLSNGPKALILSRTKQQKFDAIPGPGSYEPNFNKMFKSQSGYHLPKGDRSTLNQNVKIFTPGPGSYETAKSTMIKDKNAIGFGPQRKIQLQNLNNVPGPGKYNTINTNKILSNAPQPIFGKGTRSQSYNTLTPGRKNNHILAGTYKYNGHFTQNPKKGFSISFKNGSSLVSLSKKNIPGPGAYQLDEIDKLKFKSSSFSVPKSSRLKIGNQKQILLIPGPQKYNLNLSTFENKSFKLGSSLRKGLQKNTNVPGPGAYNYKDMKQMPKFSVPKANKSWIKPSTNPGPGNYDPKIIYSTQYQSIGVNKDDRKPFYDEKKGIPGPGMYKIPEIINQNGGFKLGNSKRPELNNSRQKIPGPGEYNIGSKLLESKSKQHLKQKK